MLNTAILKALLFTPAGRRANGEWIWGLPVIFWGMPGVGKSQITAAIARIAGMTVFVILASIREPADFLGLPVPQDGVLKYMPPEWARAAANCDFACIILDETTTCAPATQAALLRVIHERVVGDLELPGTVRMICAANPKSIAVGGRDISAPLANRMLHYECGMPDVDSWREYMIGGGGDSHDDVDTNPEEEQNRVLNLWPEAYASARGLWSSFMRKFPALLMQMPPAGNPQASRAWPSPRSCEMAARCTASAIVHRMDEIDSDRMIAMAVGEVVAKQFNTFMSENSMPDIVDWLDGKVEWEPDPRRPDLTFAVFDSAAALIKPKGEDAKAQEKRQARADALWHHMAIVSKTTPDVAVNAGITLVGAGFGGGEIATDIMADLMPVVDAAGMLRNG